MIGKITFFDGTVEKRLLTDDEIIELIGENINKLLNEQWKFIKNKHNESLTIDLRTVAGHSICGKIGGKSCKFEIYDVSDYEYNLIMLGSDVCKNVYLREVELLIDDVPLFAPGFDFSWF